MVRYPNGCSQPPPLSPTVLCRDGKKPDTCISVSFPDFDYSTVVIYKNELVLGKYVLKCVEVKGILPAIYFLNNLEKI